MESKCVIQIRTIQRTEIKVKTLKDNNIKFKTRIFDRQMPLKEIVKMEHQQKQLANAAINN